VNELVYWHGSSTVVLAPGSNVNAKNSIAVCNADVYVASNLWNSADYVAAYWKNRGYPITPPSDSTVNAYANDIVVTAQEIMDDNCNTENEKYVLC